MSANGDKTRRPRLTRQEAKARTRTLLLEAAAEVFARQGYAGASVGEIAETAGFTIGALYSNFAGKEELFLELLASRAGGRMLAALSIIAKGDAPIEERRATLARHLVEVADDNADEAVLETEFWLYAMRNREFQQRLADQFTENRDALADVLVSWARAQHRPSSLPSKDVSTMLLALFQGLVNLRRTQSSLVSEELYATAIRWLFIGITADYPGREE